MDFPGHIHFLGMRLIEQQQIALHYYNLLLLVELCMLLG